MKQKAISVAAYSAACLVLLWAISGLSRTQGFRLFAAGLVVWGIVCAFARQNRKLHFLFIFSLILTASSVLLLEAILHIKPDLLRGKIADGAYSGYHTMPGGIYRPDENTGVIQRANYARDIYWSGHWWHHSTNHRGYRGPAYDQPDVVFLGDSMIYGHGVENDQTVPAQFERLSDLRTVNLGQQGTCMVQAWIHLTRHGKSWNPKAVVVCSHYNDTTDAPSWYSLDELQKLLTLPSGVNQYPLVLECYRSRNRFRPREWWNRHVAIETRVGGVVQTLLLMMSRGRPEQKDRLHIEDSPRFVPARSTIEMDFAPWEKEKPKSLQIGWQANVHALKQIKHYCDKRGARLIVFDVGFPTAYADAMKETAYELGAEYSRAGRVVLAECLTGKEMYLRNDGHWTPLGCKIVARELIKSIAK